jgi:pimeloyl-ACP methyl ester carboxylesterase
MPTINVRGSSLNYLEVGDGIHNAIFLHGNLQSGSMWNDFMLGMPDEFHCYAFDFRGFGNSSKTADGVLVDSLADDIRYALHQIGIQRCSVLAFAEGARVAQNLAGRYPSLVYKLALMGANSFTVDTSAALAQANKLETIDWRPDAISRILKTALSLPRNRKVPDDLVASAISACQPAAVAFARSVSLSDTLELLPHITARTLIIRGGKDQIATNFDSEVLKNRILVSETVELPNARRLPIQTDLEAYRTASLKMLQSM